MLKWFYKLWTIPRVRKEMMLTHDIFVVWIAFFAASQLVFNTFYIPGIGIPVIFAYLAVSTGLTILIFWLLRLYRRVWTFAGFLELVSIYISCFLSGIVITIGAFILSLPNKGRFLIVYTVFLIGGIAFFRVFLRVFRMTKQIMSEKTVLKNNNLKRAMLIGAGYSGNSIIKAIQENGSDRRIVCCIDDDPSKKGSLLHGVQIAGGRELIIQAAQENKVNEILLAMPSAPSESIKDILDICAKTGCAVKTLPGIDKMIDGVVSISSLRDVEITDLLNREPIELDSDCVKDYICGRTVMVTGGGGSIGSELCRQIAAFEPSRLIILDIYENGAYDIQQELLRRHPELKLTVLIASIRDAKRIEEIFAEYRPSVVFHAAAHKHVPLMEECPNECVKNNVFGTLNVADSAGRNGVERFILISSDKAVNPTNIMGASKRASEMIIQGMNSRYATHYAAVRFGNVINSNGSVFPLFKKQIERGGPVTVTHKDIVRFFMTIPEAVSLVLQTGRYAEDGEVFILDMGAPVRVDDMARKLIKLSGYEPDVDMEVRYIGLRPGEKLYEELITAKEKALLRKTDNKLIYIAQPTPFDVVGLWRDLAELRDLSTVSGIGIQRIMAKIVDTYHCKEELNADIKNSSLDIEDGLVDTLVHDDYLLKPQRLSAS